MSDEDKKPAEGEKPAAEEAKEPETKEEKPAEETEPKAEDAAEKPAEETKADEAPEEPAEEAPDEPEETTPEGKVYREKLEGFEDLRPGQTVRVHERIRDVNARGEEKSRIQVFEGLVIGIRGAGISRTMTIRKVSNGHGVEKIYPLNSPVIEKVELVKVAKVRRAKLNYLKNPKRRFRRKLKETWIKK